MFDFGRLRRIMEHVDSIKANTLSSPTVEAVKKPGKPVDSPRTLTQRILYTSFPICIFGMIANLLVIWLFCCQIKKTPLTLYFLNMAIANLLIIVCNVYVVITYFTSLYPSLMFRRIMQMLHISAFDTSFFFITVIAVERYLILKYPLWCNQHRPKNFSVIMCVILWGLSWIVSFVTYYGCFPRFDISVNTLLNNCKTANIIEIIVEVFVFLPSMIFSTCTIWNRIHTRQPQTPVARLDVTIVGLVLLFLIINAPIRITQVITTWAFYIDRFVLGKISLLLDSVNSAGNPFVYIIVGCRKSQKAILFLERALSDGKNTTEKIRANEADA
ncbi:mas-related G-protein coupled receptor member H-like [Sceloporus undulatus]|uniref:mas-related G-protein coupled receptor member H-like n=1 Tax=Sceloporus undulatus TaxID=8520 RepID=UPI001C4C9ECA|nr:mas-related G-protein coupled receptor member H-like [Sceloporus undulatus]